MTGISDEKALMRQIQTAAGKEKAELVLKNANIVNVFTNSILTADVAIDNGYIIGVGHYDGIQEKDLSGKFLCPGFIDGHIHLESSMVSPNEFEKAVMPHGTTAVITDPHEIANVAGHEGIRYMLDMTEKLSLDVFFMIPSCVPATYLDEAGAVLNAADIEPYFTNQRVLGLAELMNAYGVVNCDRNVIGKIAAAKKHDKIIDGHAPALGGKELSAYAGIGIRSDHECVDIKEAIEKMQQGQWIMIREGTAAKNLEALVNLCSAPYYQRCMFVTDDKHPGDLVKKGHMDYIIKKAVSLGANPIIAIKMASWNAAQYFGLKDRGAIAPGYRADMVVLDNLLDFGVQEVWKDGKLWTVTHSEEKELDEKYPGVFHSFNMRELSEKDLKVKSTGSYERVIELVPGELLTKEFIVPKCHEEGLPIGVSLKEDILKAVVCERHHCSGHIGIGFIKGYGLKKGAVASSVAHDSHNLIVIGTNDQDITMAANCVRANRGGLAVVADGKVLGELPLPITGLMSSMDIKETEERLEELKKRATELGISPDIDPFMTLAFTSLPVIPKLRLNTYGLINVTQQKVVDAFFDDEE